MVVCEEFVTDCGGVIVRVVVFPFICFEKEMEKSKTKPEQNLDMIIMLLTSFCP